MHPVLFKIDGFMLFGWLKFGPFVIWSYGFMLSMAFVAAAALLYLELKRKRLDPDLVLPTSLLAVVFGWIGSKLFDAFEQWDRFLEDPIDVLMRGAGLTFLGGFLLATAAICLFLRARRVSILRFCDAVAPGLMIAYGIARIGCQLSGDGDYGLPTDLPWGMAYPKGTVPTLEVVHPTPVYESLASFVLFGALWRLRRRAAPDGWLFFLYLVLSGLERFFVEFIRLNPEWLLGLSQSQLISLSLVVVGLVGLLARRAGRGEAGGGGAVRAGP